MTRIYHHYLKWEDFQAGMWRTIPASEHEAMLAKAIEFTGNAELYGSFMMRVVAEWPISCEQNLTNEGMNRKAWVGHAATSMAINCPEYITREAWGHLTDQQRDEANAKAQEAIDTWVEQHKAKSDQYALQF